MFSACNNKKIKFYSQKSRKSIETFNAIKTEDEKNPISIKKVKQLYQIKIQEYNIIICYCPITNNGKTFIQNFTRLGTTFI